MRRRRRPAPRRATSRLHLLTRLRTVPIVAGQEVQRDLILILARDLTSRLATPSFVVDAEGTLVYFNEAAEPVLGMSYAESGELRAGGWATGWSPTDPDGRAIPLEELPLGIAFREGRPAHRAMHITGGDGVGREIEVTAFPLKTSPEVTVGAIAVFWQRSSDASG
jgi:hypothetical protein